MSCHTLSCPISSFCPIMQFPVLSYPTPCGTDRPTFPFGPSSCPFLLFPVLPCPAVSCPIPNIHSCTALLLSCLFLSNKVNFLFVPIYHNFLFHVLSCPFLIYPALSCFVIVYTFLSCKVISCHVLYACLHSPYTNQFTWKSIYHFFFFFFKWGLLIEPFLKVFLQQAATLC